jgi:hypothetical protein
MQKTSDTTEERFQRRRVRRWKRRARILGPFLGVPLLLLTLSVSVDLIEYQPQEEFDRLTDRPIRLKRQTITPPIRRASLSVATQTASPIPSPSETDTSQTADRDSIDLDMTSPSTRSLQPPTPPDALGRH